MLLSMEESLVRSCVMSNHKSLLYSTCILIIEHVLSFEYILVSLISHTISCACDSNIRVCAFI